MKVKLKLWVDEWLFHVLQQSAINKGRKKVLLHTYVKVHFSVHATILLDFPPFSIDRGVHNSTNLYYLRPATPNLSKHARLGLRQ